MFHISVTAYYTYVNIVGFACVFDYWQRSTLNPFFRVDFALLISFVLIVFDKLMNMALVQTQWPIERRGRD